MSSYNPALYAGGAGTATIVDEIEETAAPVSSESLQSLSYTISDLTGFQNLNSPQLEQIKKLLKKGHTSDEIKEVFELAKKRSRDKITPEELCKLMLMGTYEKIVKEAEEQKEALKSQSIAELFASVKDRQKETPEEEVKTETETVAEIDKKAPDKSNEENVSLTAALASVIQMKDTLYSEVIERYKELKDNFETYSQMLNGLLSDIKDDREDLAKEREAARGELSEYRKLWDNPENRASLVWINDRFADFETRLTALENKNTDKQENIFKRKKR